jgi:signal transduction histidine kinase
LITEHPKSGLPADIALPARWIDQPLYSELRLRSENMTLQGQLAQEMGISAAHVEAQKRAVREVDLLKNAIVRTVSHELKTPLLHVKSAVAMLSEDHERDWHTLIGYATEATARLEVAVKNVTQLADVLEIKFQPMQVTDAVELAARNLRRIWEQKENVDRIKINVPRRLPLVWADKTAVGVALQHLIDNGLKFSKRSVEVTASVSDEHVVIAVSDHGIGIPQDKLDAIFDPFYQVENSDTRRFGGLGVGLSIVRLILDRHSALVNVESVIGMGSTFSFMLPCVE